MKDETIKKGDLVVIYKGSPCCNIRNFIGTIDKVSEILKTGFDKEAIYITECPYCGDQSMTGGDVALLGNSKDGFYVPTLLLKKIPPLEDLAGIEDHAPLIKGVEA